jgi:hypothetical protein
MADIERGNTGKQCVAVPTNHLKPTLLSEWSPIETRSPVGYMILWVQSGQLSRGSTGWD